MAGRRRINRSDSRRNRCKLFQIRHFRGLRRAPEFRLAPTVPPEWESQMSATLTMLLLLSAIALGAIFCVFGPLAALGVMFWNWHKELRQSSRLRLARTTQVR
jgi:hypothetical protein